MTNLDDADAVRRLSPTEMNKLLKPDLVRALNALLQETAASNEERNDLTKMLREVLKEIREMREEREHLKKEVESLRMQQLALVEKMDHKMDEKNPLPSLLLGDSLLRDVDQSKLKNTKVISKSGGKLSDLLKELENTDSSFARIVVCGGTNDCSVEKGTEFDVDKFSHDTKQIVDLATSKVNNPLDVVMYTIPPRLDETNYQHNIETANACIVSLAEKSDESDNSADGKSNQFTVVNNNTCFKLSDGSVNDGYLCTDGLHLSWSGTRRLLKNASIVTDGDPVKKMKKKKNGTKKQPATKNGLNGDQASSSTDRIVVKERDENWETVGKKKRFNRPRRYDPEIDYSQNSKTGCWNCGETNHISQNCRYGQKISCRLCGQLGHKAKFCVSA